MSFPYRAALFDLDGTLYRGTEAVPGAAEAVKRLKSQGVLVRYLTNNATLTRDEFAAKLAKMGFPVEPTEVHSSATGSAAHLSKQGKSSAFVVGMPALVATLRACGIEVTNADEDGIVSPTGRQAETVVVGMCRTLSYPLLDGAMQQILNGGEFIATNPDTTFPMEGSRLSPGAGSIVAAVRTCSGVEPFVVGKPKPFLVEIALREAGLSPAEALVVGDRIDTDIEAGVAAQCPTYLVLTGVEKTLPAGQLGGESVCDLLTLD